MEYQEIASAVAAYRWAEILALRAGVIERIPCSEPRGDLHLPPLRNKGKDELHVSLLPE